MNKYIMITQNGQSLIHDGILNEDDLKPYVHNPIRTKLSHPYGYDPILHWKREDLNPNGSAYGDRLLSWYPNCDELMKKHELSQYWDKKPEKVQAFLREYLKSPDLELTRIVELCHMGSGYPVFYFSYYCPKT